MRSRISISLGASILEVAHHLDPITGHLRRVASDLGRGFLFQAVGRVNCSILKLRQTEVGAIVEGRQSSHKIAPAPNSPQAVIPLNGSRSALVASYCHNRQDRSVYIASCCLIVLSQTQVCYSLPLLFFIVLMESFWTLYSKALQSIIFQSCVCWTGVLSLTWPWRSLSLNWLVGVDVLAVTELRFYSLHIETSKLCRFLVWKLVSHVYGLVFPQCRPSGSVGLLLVFFMVDILAFNSFTVGVSMLILRLLLYYFYCLSITTLLHWPTRMMCSLFTAYGKFLTISFGSLLLWFIIL